MKTKPFSHPGPISSPCYQSLTVSYDSTFKILPVHVQQIHSGLCMDNYTNTEYLNRNNCPINNDSPPPPPPHPTHTLFFLSSLTSRGELYNHIHRSSFSLWLLDSPLQECIVWLYFIHLVSYSSIFRLFPISTASS